MEQVSGDNQGHAFEGLVLTVPVFMESCRKSVARHWQEGLIVLVTLEEAVLFPGLGLMLINTLHLPPVPSAEPT